jgi:hypothetical protein
VQPRTLICVNPEQAGDIVEQEQQVTVEFSQWRTPNCRG